MEDSCFFGSLHHFFQMVHIWEKNIPGQVPRALGVQSADIQTGNSKDLAAWRFSGPKNALISLYIRLYYLYIYIYNIYIYKHVYIYIDICVCIDVNRNIQATTIFAQTNMKRLGTAEIRSVNPKPCLEPKLW